MKTNDSLYGVAPPGGPGTLKPADYGPLADYFVKFVKAYQAAGVPIWAITPQNEPLQPTADYPGMFLSASQEATFVHDYLRPALVAAGLGAVRIYGYDYTWAGSESYVPALASGVGPGDLAGIAYHCYFGAPEAMSAIHNLYPQLDAIEDECSTGISALSPIQMLIRSTNNWASAALMWNVALDPSGGPKMGSGCLNCIGVTTIDPTTGSVAYTGDNYELGQASKFVQPGAQRIQATVTPPTSAGNSPVAGLEATAFRNPDGSIVVVATNSGPALTFDLRRPDGQHITYSLPEQQQPRNGTDNSQDAGIVTFAWQGG
jgi:glucosylceramidase